MEKHSAPKVAVSIFYNVGSHDEPDGQKGINALISTAILQGTEKYPSDLRQKKRDEYSASYGDRNGKDITLMWTEIQKEQLEFVLDLESDRMVNINIDTEMLSSIKDRYKTDWDEYNKNELQIAFSTAISAIMPDGHPYKINPMGIPEQVDTLSLATCQKWYKNYYSPNNAVLVIVGDITPLELSTLVYIYFGNIKAADELPIDIDLTLEYINPQTSDVSNYKLQANPSWFRLYGSLTTPLFFMPSARDDDAIVLEHLHNILRLDSNKRGKIFKRMSKNRRLFVDTEIDFFSHLGYSGFTIIGMNILRKGSERKINNQILSTFEYLGNNGVGQKLLDEYKKSELLSSYENDYSYKNIANALGYAELIMGDYHFYNRKRALLKELTNEDIKRVAKKYFNKSNMQTVTIILNKKNWFT
ncbi:MAG: pitrilysin family protein, partial [SAR202 cluster bacterium]|nr:pitrilysin family protein [SAR202 cluster bacterium]